MGTEKSEEQKRGTQEERKSLTNGKEECKRRTEESAPQAKEKMNCVCIAFVLCHRTGRPPEPLDIAGRRRL